MAASINLQAGDASEHGTRALSLLLCSRATTRLPRLLVHQLLDIQEQTTITYVLSLSLSLSLRLPLPLHPAISILLSLHLSRPHLIIFRLNREGKREREREREGRDETGPRLLTIKTTLRCGARSVKRPAVRQANSKVD